MLDMMPTAQANDQIVLNIVDNIAQFEALEDDWATLIANSASGTVFMRWEWHFTWWQVFAGKRDSLHIITWRKNGRLVGLLPLYTQSSLIPGADCIQFIGTGESQIDEVASEYGDLLVEPAVESEVVAAMLEHLLGFGSWQQMEFMCLLEDSLLAQALNSREALNMLTTCAGLRYRIPLAGTEEEYLKKLSGGRTKRIKRSLRAVERDGGLDTTNVTSLEEFDEAFQQLAELSNERQVQKHRKSAFASNRFTHFHAKLCQRLYGVGAADIVRFHQGSRLLAVLYCFYDDDCCYYYQSGFTHKDANRFMPLTVAHLREMQSSRAAGRRYYDLMRGRPPCYKDEFYCQTTRMIDVCIFKSPLPLRLVTSYRSLRSMASRWLKSVKS